MLIIDDKVYRFVGHKFGQYLKDYYCDLQLVKFNGKSSTNEIKRISDIGKTKNASAVYDLGGKTDDTAKAVADNLDIPICVMLTLASTDAPCSRLSVICPDDHAFDHYRFYNHNPNLVLVDSQVVAGAPVSLLISGVADALATNGQAQAIAQTNADNMDNEKQTLVGNAIA